jgi:hypothetical protein
MSKKRPFFQIHQIETGLYTSGGEFFLETGDVYIGPYHKLPNEQYFTGFKPLERSIELFTVVNDVIGDPVYRRITKIKTGKYIQPIFKPQVATDDEMKSGEYRRYFVQQKNDPIGTIIEIDKDQYASVNITNGPGINGLLWRSISFIWRVNTSNEDIYKMNAITINGLEGEFRGLLKYLKIF